MTVVWVFATGGVDARRFKRVQEPIWAVKIGCELSKKSP